MTRFLDAIRLEQLKALDATIVFLKRNKVVLNKQNKATVSVAVIYPPAESAAPVPQPMIFIGSSATIEDLTNMLEEHAPKIAAYNKLFDEHLLPSLTTFSQLLKKFPELEQKILAEVGEVNEAMKHEAMFRAYLSEVFKLDKLILEKAKTDGAGVLSGANFAMLVTKIAQSPRLRATYNTEVIQQIKAMKKEIPAQTLK